MKRILTLLAALVLFALPALSASARMRKTSAA